MLEGHHFAVGSETSQGRAFPRCLVAFNVIEYRGRQDEKSAVDQAAIAAWLLDKARDPVARALDGPIAPRRKHRRNRGERPC